MMNHKPYIICIIGILYITGCASSDIRQKPVQTYQAYLTACQTHQMEKAESLLHESAPDPCPSEDILSDLPQNPQFDLMAQNGDETFIYENGGWKWTANHLPLQDEVLTAFSKLKYALKTHDISKFKSMLLGDVVHSFSMMTDESLASNADLNDLYASMAVTQVPWYRLDSDQAYFELPSWKLTFKYKNGEWRLIEMSKH